MSKKPRSDKEILEHFNKVDDLFDKLGSKNKEELENAKIKPIHRLFPFAQNGICAMIAVPGTGKTRTYLKLSSRQEGIFDEPFFETVVICSTSDEFDKTVITFKEAIDNSELIAVKDTEIMEFIEGHTQKTILYNTLMKFINSDFKRPDENMEKIIAENRLNKKEKLIEFIAKKLAEIGWSSYPSRMLLIFDDFANHPLLKKREDPLSRMLKKLRHFHINVIISVQTTKDIPKNLRRLLTDIILFPGISEEDFIYLMKETPTGSLPHSHQTLWEHYRKIKDKHTAFRLHLTAQKAIVGFPEK